MREHQDGEFPFANDFNAVVRDALASGTLVSSGCTVGDGGSSDMTVNVASGTVFVNGSEISVSSQSVTLQGADSNDDRYDIVVVDDTGAASAVTGTASSTPQAPSIPSAAILLAIVEVPAGAGGVTNGNIFDTRVVVDGIPNDVITQGSGSGLDADTVDGGELASISDDDSTVMDAPGDVNYGRNLAVADDGDGTATVDVTPTAPLYGDGSDGAITRSTNGDEVDEIIHATEFTVESSVTRTVTNPVFVVHATKSITIDGTLSAAGQGAGNSGDHTSGGTGGSGGSGDSDNTTADGSSGSDGQNSGGGGGGGGGGGDSHPGQDGDPGGGTGSRNWNQHQMKTLRQFLAPPAWNDIYNLAVLAGGGGGGGGDGGDGGNDFDGTPGSGGVGGDGGDGGGTIVLVAPRIDISGTVDVSGTAGSDGMDGQAGDPGTPGGGGGGGGGGGAGGTFIAVSADTTVSGFVDVSGGIGGRGGAGGDADWSKGEGYPGGDGGTGKSGLDIRIQPGA